MIMQFVLTGSFLLIAVYGWAHIARVRAIGIGMVLLSIAAIYFVWRPDVTNQLAHVIGIGRGADLVMYCFLVFVVFQLVLLHSKLSVQLALITQLAREIAISRAHAGDQAEGDGGVR